MHTNGHLSPEEIFALNLFKLNIIVICDEWFLQGFRIDTIQYDNGAKIIGDKADWGLFKNDDARCPRPPIPPVGLAASRE